MDVVELGGIRLHVVGTHPGLAGESDRVMRSLTKIAPAVVLGDVDTDDALRMRSALSAKSDFAPSFVDALFRDETQRRFAADTRPGEHPLATAARYARDRRADFLPLRPIAHKPGFFARRRATKAAANATASDPAAFPAAFARALADAEAWDARADVEAAQARLAHALRDGRAPVVAILQAHRRAAYETALANMGRIPA